MSPQSKLALFIAGGLTLLLALAGLGGGHAQALEDFRLAHGWVPAQCAVSFTIAGLSLIFVAFGLPRLAQLGGLTVLTAAVVLLLEQAGLVDLGVARVLIWSVGLSPYALRIGSHSALCFGVLGLTLLLMGSRRPFPQRGFVLAVLSAFIFALPVSEMLGFALNLAAGVDGFFAVMAFTGRAHLLVGWAVLTFAWHDLPPARRERLPWPPLLLMVGVLAAAFLLWEALRAEEDAHLRARVTEQARTVSSEIETGMQRYIEPMVRLSGRWAQSETPLGRELAAALLRNINGLERIESIRGDGSTLWSIHDPSEPRAYTAAQVQRREALLWNARGRGDTTLSEAIPDARGSRILVAVPSERRAGTSAAVLLVSYRLQPLLADILRDPHHNDYAVSIIADDAPIYQRGEAAEGSWTQAASVNLYGRQWQVRVTPLPGVVAAAHSPLPGTVLFAGFLLTIVLVWVHYLAQKAVLHARDLGTEIGRREHAEAALQRANEALEQRVQKRTDELHRSAEALVREKELLAVTLDSIGDGVITTDIRGHVISMNKVAEALTGWHAKEAAEQPLNDVFRLVDENDAPVDSHVDALLNAEAVNPPRSAVLLTRTGERKFVADSVAPIRDRQGKLLGAVLVVRDVTGVRKLEDELFRAKNLESIGLLAGGIAHDFNNIMTGILGNVSVAKLYTRPDDPAYENLEEAEKGFARARDLTLQLLTFSRGGAPIRKMASIGELLQDTATFMLRGSNVRHQLVIPPDLWPASIDIGQISQALNNLLINAKQAMPDGGTLTITAENVRLGADKKLVTPGKYVKITLQDRGMGIAAEDLPRIFEPYFTTKDIGTGLGLSTTYAIIRRHQGHIEVESTPGVGTTFSIYLPAAAEARKAPRPKVEQEELCGQGRVLLMDDEESVREVAAKMLRALGYEPTVATNGQEAIDAFNAHMDAFRPFDAVVLDLTVKGGMGGVECLRRLRQRDPGARVIASSGYSNDPVMADYGRYGFDAAITKPYRLEELSRAVHRVISGRLGSVPADNR
jgi:PAS domain S-box-containing protein